MAHEEITLASLAKEFVELVGETTTRYYKAESQEEKDSIVKEITDTGEDLFHFFGEELSEVFGEASKRFKEAAEESDEFFRDMREVYGTAEPSYTYDRSSLVILDSENELWSQQEPVPGDHIHVRRLGGVYAHHGIYIGDDTVIHFAPPAGNEVLDWDNARVRSSSLTAFLKAGKVEVKIYTDEERESLYPVEQIIRNAKSALGSGNYNLIFNNCEHFANACTLGKYRSPQVEEFFNMVAKLWK